MDNKAAAKAQSTQRWQLCLGLEANEIQIPYDKHHKVSSLLKCHQDTHNSVRYEVIWKNIGIRIVD